MAYIYKGKDYTSEFDPMYYYGAYVDLRKAFGYNEARLLEHWVNFGKREGRKATGPDKKYVYNEVVYNNEFDPRFYYNKYPDLQKAFGYHEYSLLQHWATFGKKEGRQAKEGGNTKLTSDGAVYLALKALRDRSKYAYFYGAKGQTLTDATMNALWNAEPGHFGRYTAAEKAQIFNNSRGRIGYDCSGFTGWLITGDHSYSKEQASHGKKVAVKDAVPGSVLFTTFGGTGRHIGLYIGNGLCVHMGNESTDANIAAGKDTVRLDKMTDLNWETATLTDYINYEN